MSYQADATSKRLKFQVPNAGQGEDQDELVTKRGSSLPALITGHAAVVALCGGPGAREPWREHLDKLSSCQEVLPHFSLSLATGHQSAPHLLGQEVSEQLWLCMDSQEQVFGPGG
eukprot:9747601-Lingulodinium_polyedra.AAC.1